MANTNCTLWSQPDPRCETQGRSGADVRRAPGQGMGLKSDRGSGRKRLRKEPSPNPPPTKPSPGSWVHLPFSPKINRAAARGGRLRAHGAGALSIHPSPPSRSCPKPRGPGEPRLISSLCPGPHGPCANQRTVALAAGSPLPWPGLPAWGSSPAPSPAGTVRAAFPSEAQPQHPGGVTRRLSSRKGVHGGVTQHVSHHCSCPHSLLRSRTLWLVGGRLFPPDGSGSQAGKELGAKR